MKRHLVLSVLLILSFLLSACGQGVPTPAPQPATPTPRPTSRLLAEALAQNQDLPPQVIGRSPVEGQEVGPQDALSISFDQSMDPQATGDALQVVGPDQQPVQGKVSWSGPRTLVFKPGGPLEAATTYLARLGTGAKS